MCSITVKHLSMSDSLFSFLCHCPFDNRRFFSANWLINCEYIFFVFFRYYSSVRSVNFLSLFLRSLQCMTVIIYLDRNQLFHIIILSFLYIGLLFVNISCYISSVTIAQYVL